VRGAGPGRDPGVVLVELVEPGAFAVGEGERPALQRPAGARVGSWDVPVEEPAPLGWADRGGAERGDLGGEVRGQGVCTIASARR